MFLSLPATSSRQLLVPAALALALESVRSPSRRRRRLDGRCRARARGRASDLRDLPLDPVRRLPRVCACSGTRADLGTGSLALGALVAPAALFLLWLRPIVNDTRSVSPDAGRAPPCLRAVRESARRPLGHVVQPRARGVHARGCGCDRCASARPDRGPRGPAALGCVRRRRLARGVRVPCCCRSSFTSLADVVSISQARRAAGFLPFAFAFAGGMGVLARLVGPILLPLSLGAGMFLQIVYPGDFEYVLKTPAPAWIVWLSVAGTVAALVVGLLAAASRARERRSARVRGVSRPGHRRRAARSASSAPARDRDPVGRIVRAVRGEVPAGDVVFSDPETSFRLAAFAPVYIASAPPGHVADTEKNSPLRARPRRAAVPADRRLSIPERYSAGVRRSRSAADEARTRSSRRLPGQALRRSTGRSSPARPSRLRRESRRGGGRRAGGRDWRSRGAPPRSGTMRPGSPSPPPCAPCGATARRCVRSESRQRSRTRSSRTTPSPPR